MNKKVSELVKVDTVVADHAFASAGQPPAVSDLIDMTQWGKALVHFTLYSDDLENDAVIDFGIVDDTVAAVTATGDLATRAGNDETIKRQLTVAGDLALACTAMDVTPTYAAGTITINGTVFTRDAGGGVAADGTFNTLTELVDAINFADIGIEADETATELELRVADPGSRTISFETDIGGITDDDYAILQVDLQMEVDASELNAGATGIYAVLDYTVGTGAADATAVCVRGAPARYSPRQTGVLATL